MKKETEKLIKEMSAINYATTIEMISITSDKNYSRYHKGMYNKLSALEEAFYEEVGCNLDNSHFDNVNYISMVNSSNLSSQNKKALDELRQTPLYKRVMNLEANANKYKLEKYLGEKISPQHVTLSGNNEPVVVYKTEDVLNQELDRYNSKLYKLLSCGAIKKDLYDFLEANLQDLYSYYISCCKGEQEEFKRISNKQLEKLEQSKISSTQKSAITEERSLD